MNHTMILSYVTFIYFVSFVFYLFKMILKKEILGIRRFFSGVDGTFRAHTGLDFKMEGFLQSGIRTRAYYQSL